MPKSIKNRGERKEDVRCSNCNKLLATKEGIKCPRCKKIHSPEQAFAENLVADTYSVSYLWSLDGSRGSTIVIRKEIWIDIGGQRDCVEFPVFFIYNYMDPSKACSTDSGCRVNQEPIIDFKKALGIAKEHESEARASGKWVEAKDIKEPPVKIPSNGIYTFRDLQRLITENRPVLLRDLTKTLAWYSGGLSIVAEVAISIIRAIDARIKIKKADKVYLCFLAEQGAAKHPDGKEKNQWLSLARAI